MCLGGGGGGDGGAAQARAEEDDRQKKVTESNSIIDRIVNQFFGKELALDEPAYNTAVSKHQADVNRIEAEKRKRQGNTINNSGLQYAPQLAGDLQQNNSWGGGNNWLGSGGRLLTTTPPPSAPSKDAYMRYVNTGDNYFDNATGSYLDYYLPQLDEQYGDAKRSQVFNLADQGLLASTVAGRSHGKLQDTYNLGRDKIKNEAIGYGDRLKRNLSDAESELRSMAAAGISPSNISNLAITRTKALTAPEPFDPLSDFFASLIAQQSNRGVAQQAGFKTTKPLIFNSNSNNAVRNVS